jgi:hypothetical protein
MVIVSIRYENASKLPRFLGKKADLDELQNMQSASKDTLEIFKQRSHGLALASLAAATADACLALGAWNGPAIHGFFFLTFTQWRNRAA